MPEIKRILATTDFSSRAELALERAARLAAGQAGELHLLHVIGSLPLEAIRHFLTDTPLETEQKLVNWARAELQRDADELSKKYAITVHTQARIGRVHRQICEYAKAAEVDLIVLGAQGENFVQALFLGTTVSKVLDEARPPVLIVREPSPGDYRQVLVPVDFSASSVQALDTALKLAAGAEIHVLHAFEVPFEGQMHYAGVSEDTIRHYRAEAQEAARQNMRRFLRNALGEKSAAAIPLVTRGYAPAVIREQARTLGADLIVMGKHGAAGLDEVLLGSVTRHVLHETGCDLLVVGLT